MLGTLSRILRTASLTATPREALDLLLGWTVQNLEIDVCALYLHEKETGRFELFVARGDARPTPRLVGAASLVARRREPVVSTTEGDIGRDLRGRLAKQGFHAYLEVPVIRFGKVVAVLENLRISPREHVATCHPPG